MAWTAVKETRIGVLDLGPNTYVSIMATEDVDRECALAWAQMIIDLQREVLAKREPLTPGTPLGTDTTVSAQADQDANG
jgi:hypothetical protein